MSGDHVELSPLFTWRGAIIKSDLPPTGRHLALTLSLFMNEAGGSAYPGIDRLVEATGLGRATVIRWRQALHALGWLRLVKQGGLKGADRVASEYAATVPSNYASSWADASKEVQDDALDRRKRAKKDDPSPDDGSGSQTGTEPVPVPEPDSTGMGTRLDGSGSQTGTGLVAGPQHAIEHAIEHATITPRPAAVANDDGPCPTGTDSRGRELTENQILWATIAASFGWDPRLRDPDQKKQVLACATKLKNKGVTASVDLDDVKDRAWWLQVTDRDATPAMLGERWGRITPDAAVLRCRHQAATLVAMVVNELGLGPAGRCRRQQIAEAEVARLLVGGDSEEAIVGALRNSRTWTHDVLGLALDRAEQRQAYASAPTKFDGCLSFDLVELLQQHISPDDVFRVGKELESRIGALNESQRDRLLTKLNNAHPNGTNGSSDVVGALIALIGKSRPTDPEREAGKAADRAVWPEALGGSTQPALSIGGGS